MTQVKVTISYIVELDPANAEHYDYPESPVSLDQSDTDKVLNMAKEDVDAVNQGMCLINELAIGDLKVVSVEVVEEKEDLSGPHQDWELEQRKAQAEDFDATYGWGYSPMASD